MRLTRAGEYAVRCALFLAYQGTETVARRKDIARTMEIPHQFLGKIAQQLARAGIIEIIQGAKGGFRLLVPPERLTLLEVVEAVIGEIYLNDCVIHPDSCSRVSSCPVHRIWEKARNELRETLRQTDFKALLAEESCIRDLLGTVSTANLQRPKVIGSRFRVPGSKVITN